MTEVRYSSSKDVVYICGSFNDWEKTPMERFAGDSKIKEYRHVLHTKLLYPEKVTFKFVVNEAWLTSRNYEIEIDQYGNQNNVIFVHPSHMRNSITPFSSSRTTEAGSLTQSTSISTISIQDVYKPTTKISSLIPNYQCSYCSKTYDTEDFFMLPCLLTCGHTICRNCFNQNKNNGQIKCPNCSRIRKLKSPIDWKIVTHMFRASIFTEQKKYYSNAFSSISQSFPAPSTSTTETFLSASVMNTIFQNGPNINTHIIHTPTLDNDLVGVGERNRRLLTSYYEKSDLSPPHISSLAHKSDDLDTKCEISKCVPVTGPTINSFGFTISPLEFSISPKEESESEEDEDEDDDNSENIISRNSSQQISSSQYWSFEFCECNHEYLENWKTTNHIGTTVSSAISYNNIFECSDLGLNNKEPCSEAFCEEHKITNNHFCFDHMTPICVHCRSSTHCGHTATTLSKAERILKYCLLRRLSPLQRADEDLTKQALFYKCVLNNLKLIEEEQKLQIKNFYSAFPDHFKESEQKDMKAANNISNGKFFPNRLSELIECSKAISDFDNMLTRLYINTVEKYSEFHNKQVMSTIFMIDITQEYGRKIDDLILMCRSKLDVSYQKIPIAVVFVPQQQFDPNQGTSPNNSVFPIEHQVPMVNYTRMLAFSSDSPPDLDTELNDTDYEGEEESKPTLKEIVWRMLVGIDEEELAYPLDYTTKNQLHEEHTTPKRPEPVFHFTASPAVGSPSVISSYLLESYDEHKSTRKE